MTDGARSRLSLDAVWRFVADPERDHRAPMTRPRRAPAWLPLFVVLALGACGAGDGASPAASSAASGGPSASATSDSPAASGSFAPPASGSPAASPDVATPAAGTFENPVIDANFADPFVLEVDGAWYAYATGNLTYNIQVATSTDLVTWSRPREALPRLPFWQPNSTGLTWAPEVIQTSAGFVMHYTGRDVQAGRQCLAVAVAASPEGPFVDESREPLACQLELGGSIDSTPFTDADGSRWLAWKNDGNCCGMDTRFFVQRLDETATRLRGRARDMGVGNDRPWERHVIEAPTLLLHERTYYLFYSANDYGSPDYAVGYATSDALMGPYVDAEENPILVSGGEAAGPGHQSVVRDDEGDLWMAYHAWDSERVGDSIDGRRALWLDPLVFEDGRPAVRGPTDDPQPVP